MKRRKFKRHFRKMNQQCHLGMKKVQLTTKQAVQNRKVSVPVAYHEEPSLINA